MQARVLTHLVLAATTIVMLCGCQPPVNPNQGFTISTQEKLANGSGLPGPAVPLKGTLVWGEYSGEGSTPPGGSVYTYDAYTDDNGLYYVSNGVAPAYWDDRVWFPSYCNFPLSPDVYLLATNGFQNEYAADNDYIGNLGQVEWDCVVPPGVLPGASSRFAFSGSTPSSVTLDSINPFSTQYGPPQLDIYSGLQGAPSHLTTVTASSVASNGSAATFPLPAGLPEGAYAFSTSNLLPNGQTVQNSLNFFAVANSTAMAGNPFGVAVAAQSTETINCVYVMEGTPPYQVMTTQCSQNSANPNTFPVISLYSANQVMIGGTPVGVGANPTAVATYSASPVQNTTTNSNGYTTTILSGALRAIVANSGSNTVTILDTVADAPVATVTVGNSPVALAVSSDSTAAYVANYRDSTVTKVNLSTNTPGATVAVGGEPTSVALSSGGTLWVGGAGFLTEINTQTMTVTATEAVPGKTIIALGYSDGVGQIVASTVDGSGSMYIDQISPSSVAQGGSYSTVASNQVATLGTHFDTTSNTQIQSFTATLASTPMLNVNEPGAPPLIVQDGWAVVTATPSGFTITDISDNIVLVSEATSSPVAAIAVDPTLNVAYLTLPDSNTVLSVPLPGTSSSTASIVH